MKRKSVSKRIISFLSAVALFVTIYVLIFPYMTIYTQAASFYKVRFHYVDGDGNDIIQPVERVMQYSRTAVDMHSQSYAKDIEGYNFMASLYGSAEGDRFQYIQNQKSSSGGIIINLKTDRMYAADSSNVPLTSDYMGMKCFSNVTDSVDLTNRANHMIDIYMVYASKDSATPNEAIAQHSQLPPDEFPFGAPDHNKRLEPNYTNGSWDGTYTLYLDVTGKAASVSNSTKADIIFIYDTSNSMDTPENPDDSNSKRRYQAAYDAVSDVADELFSFNKSGETSPRVRIGMVSYASTAKLEFDYVDNINDFKSGFAFAAKQKTYQKGTFGGTNWEDGIQTARKLYDSSHREDAEQYIIFVSDGEPTSRITKGSWYEHFDAYEYKMSNNNIQPNVLTDTITNKQYYAYGYANLSNGQYYYTGVEHAYTHSKDDARAFVNAGVNLYSIGIFNEESTLWQMNTLVNYAYTGFDYPDVQNNNYKYAGNSQALHETFSNLVHDITKNFGYGNVDIRDVMTSTTLTAGELAGHAADFKYYRNTAGGILTEWTDAPKATYNPTNKTVEWDISKAGMLEQNVTYTIGFTVWPDQASYDAIMKLNAMIDSGVSQSDADEYAAEHYPDVSPFLRKDKSGHYIIQSNADAELKYERFIIENDGKPQSLGKETAGYSFPDMETTKYYMTVSKCWNDHLQDTNRFKAVYFEIFEDYDETAGAVNTPYAEIMLDESDADPHNPYRWTKRIEISPGIIKTALNGTTPINAGHSYRVYETGYTDKNNVFHDIHNPDNYTDYRYEFTNETVVPMLYDGEMKYLGDTDGDGQLTGTNNLRGGINLYKTVSGPDGNIIHTDNEYEFIIHLTIPERFITGYENGKPVYDENAYPLWYTVYTDTDLDGNFFGEADTEKEWGTLADGEHLKIRSDQMLRIINVPIGTVYSFEEVNIPDGCTFDHGEIKVNGQTVADSQENNILTYTTQPDTAYDNTFYNRVNYVGVTLPHTGGAGTKLYTSGGKTLVCIAVLMLLINLRRRKTGIGTNIYPTKKGKTQ